MTQRPGLASSLTIRAVLLAARGEPDRALADAEEAVWILRPMAAGTVVMTRAEIKTNFATALLCLAGRLAELQRRDDAFAATERAVAIYHGIPDYDRNLCRPHLAHALLVHASVRAAAGRQLHEAIAAAVEARTIHDRLPERVPAQYRDDRAALDDLLARLTDPPEGGSL